MGYKTGQKIANDIFDDPESRRNIVGLYDLLFKMDRRNNPEFYDGNKNHSRPFSMVGVDTKITAKKQ